MSKNSAIDSLIKKRFHGASNIRGIRFQLLCSLLYAFDLYNDGDLQSLQFEGIEDFDLKGFHHGNLYVQVKFSKDSWKWSKIKGPLEGFLEDLRANPDARFKLIVNFDFQKDLATLGKFDELTSKDQKRISENFHRLCHKIGATKDEAHQLLSKTSFESINLTDVWLKLQRKCSEVYDLGSSVDSVLLIYLSKCIEWADERKVIQKADLEEIRLSIQENAERYKDFEAFGRHLIDKIQWNGDENADDFYDGKRTRPGHIAKELDVRRPKWLEKINTALTGCGICAIRSSSGQGKSALVYRYAYENWPAEHTFILNACANSEDAEKIVSYFRFRKSIDHPSYLVIDDAGWRIPLWADVVRGCAALGVSVLISIRHEDWFKFKYESFTQIETVQPTLDMDEAGDIYSLLEGQNRIHKNVVSYEWAFEKLGKPQLLMEYIYLLTHGKMLEERLREQIRFLDNQPDSAGKIELLRRVSTAHTVGLPLDVSNLVESVNFANDPQQVLQSFEDEYITISGNYISGLHLVRSNHLFELLHESFPDKTSSILNLFPLIPPEEISHFVTNAIAKLEFEIDTFFDSLANLIDFIDIAVLISCIEGIFRAGELNFFLKNKSLFDEATNVMGYSGALIFASELLPTVKPDILESLRSFGEEAKQRSEKWESILTGIDFSERGVDFVRDFLDQIKSSIPVEVLQSPSGELGILLDWFKFCNLEIVDQKEQLFKKYLDKTPFSLSAADFGLWCMGFYRCDTDCFMNWFQNNEEHIIDFLIYSLDLISLEIISNELKIIFIVNPKINAHEQTMERLNILRNAIPFCDKYCSNGIWFIPYGLNVSVDDTHKEIPSESLYFGSDIEKNVMFSEIIENACLSDNYYNFQLSWVNIRKKILEFSDLLIDGSQKVLKDTKVSQKWLNQVKLTLNDLRDSFKWLPDPPLQSSDVVKTAFDAKHAKGCVTYFEFFMNHFIKYQSNQDISAGQLSLHNLRVAHKRLQDLHEAFELLFKESFDYHNAYELKPSEIQAFEILIDLIDCMINFPPKVQNTNLDEHIQSHKQRIWAEKQRQLESVLEELKEDGIEIELPSAIHYDHPLSYVGIVLHVDDPFRVVDILQITSLRFKGIKEVADYFCFIPVSKNVRWMNEGYIWHKDELSKLVDGTLKQWELLAPRDIPQDVMNTIPYYPVQANPLVEFMVGHERLLLSLETLREIWELIVPFDNSEKEFTKKHYKNLLQKCEDYARECREIAEKLTGQLNLIIDELPNVYNQTELCNFYEKVSSSNEVADLIELSAKLQAYTKYFVRR